MTLNALHIADEVSKKNFSISSILSLLSNSNKYFKIDILCNKVENIKFLPYRFNRKIVEKPIGWLDFFTLRKIIQSYHKQKYIFHVHGLWSPIQLISLFIISFYNYPLVIHAHGMLLNEAINKNGLIKKISKKILIILLKIFFFNKKVVFASITYQELRTIKKYFYFNKHILINNPIPFNSEKYISGYKKYFVFFGRAHPHKNIILIIKSYLKAKINKKFKLFLYLIPDDKNYFKKILNLVKYKKNIFLKKPIFGKKKSKILSYSWANLLFSKSEVLSFSVLEAGINGLPSIVGKNIEVIKKDNVTIQTKNSTNFIVKKIKETSNWSYKFRSKLGKKTYKFYRNYQKKNYILFLKKLNFIYLKFHSNYEKKEIVNRKKFSFLFVFNSLSSTLNASFHSFALFSLYITSNLEAVGEVGLVNVITLLFINSLSKNSRAIINKKNDIQLLYKFFFERVLYSILFFFVFFIFCKIYYNFTSLNFILLITACILVNWILELLIQKLEINNELISLFFIFIYYVLFYFFIFVVFIIQSEILFFIALSIHLTLSFFIIKNNFQKFSFSYLIKNFDKNYIDLAFLSSLFTVFSSFIWRIFIYFNYPKDIAGILFVAFSFGSFFGTVFNNLIGPSYIYNKIKIPSKLKIIIYFYFIIIFLGFLSLKFYDFKLTYNELLFWNTLSASMLGSFFMISAFYLRHKKFFKITNDNLVFKIDITLSILIALTVPTIILFLNDVNYLQYSYLIGSLISFAIYYRLFFTKKIFYV